MNISLCFLSLFAFSLARTSTVTLLDVYGLGQDGYTGYISIIAASSGTTTYTAQCDPEVKGNDCPIDPTGGQITQGPTTLIYTTFFGDGTSTVNCNYTTAGGTFGSCTYSDSTQSSVGTDCNVENGCIPSAAPMVVTAGLQNLASATTQTSSSPSILTVEQSSESLQHGSTSAGQTLTSAKVTDTSTLTSSPPAPSSSSSANAAKKPGLTTSTGTLLGFLATTMLSVLIAALLL